MRKLKTLAQLPPMEQLELRAEVIAAFKAFWATHPDETDFAHETNLMVLFPEMLYILAFKPWTDVGDGEGGRNA